MTISLSLEGVSTSCAEEMLRVTSKMSAWTSETSLFPVVVPAEPSVVRVYKTGEAINWFVERGDVLGEAQKLLSVVKRGEVRKLVAGTGTGKSTLLPVSLVMSSGTVAVVVMPSRALAKVVSSYVKSSVCVGSKATCSAERCVDYEDIRKLGAPAVAYMAASDFLMMMASESGVLERLRPSFVYVDESHEVIPQYEVIQLLISAGRFAGTKVFLGSATSSSQNMERRDGGIVHVVKTWDPRMLMYDQVETLPRESPLHHTEVKDRTLVFVPSYEQFASLSSYYTGNALEVLELPEWATASKLVEVERSLAQKKRPVVVLLTQAHQTGYTFSAETVVDCAVTVDLVVDPEEKEVTLKHRRSTEAESIQRCGRVGRFAEGKANTVVPDDTKVVHGGSGSNDCYVALWCRLFGLSVDLPSSRRWASFVAPMSMYKVCLLLSATIHPVVLSPFVADDGSVYRGTRMVFLHFLRMQRKLVSTAPNIDVVLYTRLWQEQIMVLKAIDVEAPEFKTQYVVPAAWSLWSYVMYHALVSGESPTAWFTFKQSMLSTLREGTDGAKSIHSSIGSAAFSVSERPRTPRRDSGLGGEQLRFAAGVGGRRSLPTSPLGRVVHESFGDSGFGGQQTWEERPQAGFDGSRTRSWVQEVDKVASGVAAVAVSGGERRPVHGQARVVNRERLVTPPPYMAQESPSPFWATQRAALLESPEKRVVKRRRHTGTSVSATTGGLGSALLEPVEDSHRRRFVNLVASSDHTSLYGRLKSGDVKISLLDPSTRAEAFYCVLVMWNDAIATRLQLQAKPSGLFGLKGLEIAKVERTLGRAKLLLKAFDVYGYQYQHQRYRPQMALSLDLSEVSVQVETAELARTLGNDSYRDTVAVAHKFATSLYVGKQRVGAAYKDGAVLFTALHLWSQFGVRPREFELESVAAFVDVGNCVAIVNSVAGLRLSSASVVKRRAPLVGEMVSLFVPNQVGVTPIGFCAVLAVGDVCMYDANMPDGVSGSPLVAHSDGCIVGIHLGALASPDGSVYSQFAAIDSYTFE